METRFADFNTNASNLDLQDMEISTGHFQGMVAVIIEGSVLLLPKDDALKLAQGITDAANALNPTCH